MFKKLVLVASLVLVGTTGVLAQSGDKIVIKVGYLPKQVFHLYGG